MKENNNKIVHRLREKHCNADGFDRRPKGKPERKEGVEEDLRGQAEQYRTKETAFDGAQEDLKSDSRSKKKKSWFNSER